MSPVAYSLDGLYVSGNIGFSEINDMNLTDRGMFSVPQKDIEPDTGMALAVAIGYRPFDMLRLEGEI